jgi:hypothetical protein
MLADSKDVKTAAMSVVTRLEFVETALTAAKEKEAALIQKVLSCQGRDSMLCSVLLSSCYVMLCYFMVRDIMSYEDAMSCHPMS